jgi:hypothetical protein
MKILCLYDPHLAEVAVSIRIGMLGVFMDIYCVVTGQNESGKSVIVRNMPIKPFSLALLPG